MKLTGSKGIWVALVLTAATTSGLAAQERQAPETAAQVQLSFAPIVKRVAPAVVNVYASRTVTGPSSPFFSDPFFQQFFGNAFGGPSQRVQRSLGSGVVIAPNGLVVTNFHVVEQADEVRVALADRREFNAAVVLKDERSDLAVLRIEGDNIGMLPTIEYADSDSVEVGDLVLAIGDPFGVGQTVTSGIVSAFARVPAGPSEDQYFIQTDAAINPGNSGGALVDMQGRLIGINRMIFTPSGGSIGVGFAIPSNLVRVVAAAAEQGGVAQRPWLGAELQGVTPDIADAMDLPAPAGVLVADVDQSGPAFAAGLLTGDLIVAMDGLPIDDLGSLTYRIATKPIGGSVKFEIVREAKHYTAVVNLIAAPETVPRDERIIDGMSPFAGMTVLNLSPAVAEELSYRGALSGVIVASVASGSNADRAGFARGDVVDEVNGAVIDSTEQLAEAAREDTRRWNMVVRREGRAMQLSFRG